MPTLVARQYRLVKVDKVRLQGVLFPVEEVLRALGVLACASPVEMHLLQLPHVPLFGTRAGLQIGPHHILKVFGNEGGLVADHVDLQCVAIVFDIQLASCTQLIRLQEEGCVTLRQ